MYHRLQYQLITSISPSLSTHLKSSSMSSSLSLSPYMTAVEIDPPADVTCIAMARCNTPKLTGGLARTPRYPDGVAGSSWLARALGQATKAGCEAELWSVRFGTVEISEESLRGCDA